MRFGTYSAAAIAPSCLTRPPRQTPNTDAEEQRTVAAILAALEGSVLAKVVAESTCGATPGQGIGDSPALYHFEQGHERQAIPAAINRAAYDCTNWDMMLDGARSEGVIRIPYSAEFELPMVAPGDLGARRRDGYGLGVEDTGIVYVEGPA